MKLSGVAGVPFSQRTTSAAQIQYWTGSGYAYFYYISDATGQSGDCWASGKSLATRKIPVGAGFWFKTPETISSGATASFAGAVISSDAAKDIDVGGTQWVMVSNPFPVPLTGNMITTSGLVASTFAKRTTDAPQMQVWTGAGYKYYYYISDATGQTEDCWASGKTRVTTAVLADVGQAFWVKSSTAGKLSFNINP